MAADESHSRRAILIAHLTSALSATVYRSQLHVDLQRVPVVCRPGHAAIRVPEEWQPLHRQS